MKQTRRNKKRHPEPVRTLSEFEKSFLAELKLYDKVMETTMFISLNQHGIDADGRGLRGTKIFTRQTVVGLSLQRILPRPSAMTHHKDAFWDISSIASLSRNIIEGYLSLYYFGTETVATEDAELRFFMAQLHRNVEWYEIRRLTNPKDPVLKKFEAVISEEKARIKVHPYLTSLTEVQRGRAIRGLEMYKTKADFESELDVCNGLRRNYRLLSNLVHPLPISIERIDHDRGRGTGGDPDVSYCVMCLVLARRFLAASTVGIADHFPDALASRFTDELDGMRPLRIV